MWCVALELTFRQDLDYWTKQTLTALKTDILPMLLKVNDYSVLNIAFESRPSLLNSTLKSVDVYLTSPMMCSE